MNHGMVLWGEGMLLGPQHFQQQQRAFEQQLADWHHRILGQPWGVGQMQWNPLLLSQGMLQPESCEILFADGTHVVMPQRCALPAHRLLGDLPANETSCKVYMCLAPWSAHPGTGQNAQHNGVFSERYRTVSRQVADFLTTAEPIDMVFLQPHVTLAFEHEPHDNTLNIPVAQLVRDTQGTWTLNEHYIPPLISIQGCERLLSLLRSLREVLLAKSHSLWALHGQRNENSFEYSSKDIAAFWLHHTVNSHYALLIGVLDSAVSQARDAYQVLATLTCSLMVFSPDIQLSELPAYQPLQLQGTFETLMQIIRNLLDTVISARFIRIALHAIKPTLLAAQLGTDWPIDDMDFYLAIRFDTPVQTWLETIPLRIKIGTPDDVQRIIHTALPGIPLLHSPVVPPALPLRIGQVYFALDRSDALYAHMMQQRSLNMYIPESMRCFEFELIAVYR